MLVARCFAPAIADPPVPEAVEHLVRHLTLCHPAASLELVGLGVSEILVFAHHPEGEGHTRIVAVIETVEQVGALEVTALRVIIVPSRLPRSRRCGVSLESCRRTAPPHCPRRRHARRS